MFNVFFDQAKEAGGNGGKSKEKNDSKQSAAEAPSSSASTSGSKLQSKAIGKCHFFEVDFAQEVLNESAQAPKKAPLENELYILPRQLIVKYISAGETDRMKYPTFVPLLFTEKVRVKKMERKWLRMLFWIRREEFIQRNLLTNC